MKKNTKPIKVPLPPPVPPPIVHADIVGSGLPIPPIERIKIFSSTQWEEFVLEWADSLREEYSVVERCGGAGDMGRDIIGTCKNDDEKWENYQCKHYKHPLMPSDIWVELGKLIFYTRHGEYVYPNRYYFVAPQGAGTGLSNLLKKPEKLRAGLFANWNEKCREMITSTTKIELDADLKEYIERLDFSIFEAVPPLRIIDQHANTRWHIARFGGGLPSRPPVESPPIEPTVVEANYVRQLFDAYGEQLHRKINSKSDLTVETEHNEHCDSRIEFYSAESLRAFSRDTLPPGQFEILQDEVHSGIKDEIRAKHSDGYSRVLAVVKTARTLQLTGHALVGRISVRDYGGICHQLANDLKVKWVNNDNRK
jgi:hypothetical protein